jgi:hypothetical protein
MRWIRWFLAFQRLVTENQPVPFPDLLVAPSAIRRFRLHSCLVVGLGIEVVSAID